jgi:hypothetical protein
MSACLDSLLDPVRLADIAANEVSMETGPLRKFWVLIGQRNAPRVRLEVMARSSLQATQQHVDMCEIGERLEVIAA